MHVQTPSIRHDRHMQAPVFPAAFSNARPQRPASPKRVHVQERSTSGCQQTRWRDPRRISYPQSASSSEVGRPAAAAAADTVISVDAGHPARRVCVGIPRESHAAAANTTRTECRSGSHSAVSPGTSRTAGTGFEDRAGKRPKRQRNQPFPYPISAAGARMMPPRWMQVR
jgi:hypothetical protein